MIDMKGFFFVLTMFLFIGLHAQAYIEPVKLEVTVNKTTNLVFPIAIISIDRGSESIVVQKATENILRIKAVSPAFAETNLSVVTSDGKLYSFLVNYSPDPKYLTINVGFTDSTKIYDPLKQLAFSPINPRVIETARSRVKSSSRSDLDFPAIILFILAISVRINLTVS